MFSLKRCLLLPWLLACLCLTAAGAEPEQKDLSQALAELRPLAPDQQEDVIRAMELSLLKGKLSDSQSPLLLGLLREPRWETECRRRAGLAVACLENSQTSLEALVDNNDKVVRETAQTALQLTKLRKQAGHESKAERQEAIKAIVKLADKQDEAVNSAVFILAERFTSQEETKFQVRRAALQGLVRQGSHAAPALVEMLGIKDAFFHRAARAALVALGRHAVPDLVRAVSHRKANVRLGAVVALGDIGLSGPSRQAVLRARDDTDPTVRQAAKNVLQGVR